MLQLLLLLLRQRTQLRIMCTVCLLPVKLSCQLIELLTYTPCCRSKACEVSNRNPRTPTIRKCDPFQTQAVLNQLLREGYDALLAFTPCELHMYLRGRTLWLIGDSLMKNFYFALRCFLLDFWDHSLGECQVSSSSDTERQIYHAADTNISNPQGARVVTDLPRCIQLLAGGRICFLHSVRGEEIADPDKKDPGLLQTLYQTVAQPQDIFYINFGRWHYSNCKGLQMGPYHTALWHLGKLYEKTRSEFPNVLFKVSSHDHSACAAAQPAESAKQCPPAEDGGYPMSVGRRVTHAAQSILGRFAVPIVDVYNVTISMYFGHIMDRPIPGREVDCTHYCSPGVPEFEIWSMYKAFMQNGIAPLTARRKAGSSSSSSHSVSGSHPLLQLNAVHGTIAAASAAAAPAVIVAAKLSSAHGIATATDGPMDNLQHQLDEGDHEEFQHLRDDGLSGGQQVPPALHSARAGVPAAVPAHTASLAAQCVPVTAKVPPPGWSYYYDSLQGKGWRKAAAAHSDEASSADEDFGGACDYDGC